MIWVVGGHGMLGQMLVRSLTMASKVHVATDRDADITDLNMLRAYAEAAEPIRWIVNCAAYTAVDRAEDEPDLAVAINVTGVANLATVAKEQNAAMLHVSTDYVFPGNVAQPLSEDAPTGPRSVYGRTKLAGEERLRQLLARHVILRTAWLYGPDGNNFVYNMLRLMRTRDALGVVDDQIGSPTYTDDLAGAILAILAHADELSGTYHFCNLGHTSWYGFAREIQTLALAQGQLSHSCVLHPIPSREYPTKATRPHYSVLSTRKIQATLGLRIRSWQAALAAFFADYAGTMANDDAVKDGA